MSLKSLEEIIRPRPAAAPPRGELLGALLVLVAAAMLLRIHQSGEQRYYNEVIGQMLSFYLLPSLGFMLALRCGAIDLSVWAVAGLGGVVAAGLVCAGAGVGFAILAAAGVGAAIGALHGLIVARLRVPAPIITLVTGLVIVFGLGAVIDGRAVHVPSGSLDAVVGWLPDARFSGESPLMLSRPFILRLLMVAGVYLLATAVVSAVTSASYAHGHTPSPRKALWASLCASGALAGLGGAIWLLDYGSAPLPRQVIGDLRVPAAAILAGAMLYRGRQRVMLAMLCLPASLLVATLWQLEVVFRPVAGYPPQVALLIVLTIAVHLLIRAMSGAARPRPAASPPVL